MQKASTLNNRRTTGVAGVGRNSRVGASVLGNAATPQLTKAKSNLPVAPQQSATKASVTPLMSKQNTQKVGALNMRGKQVSSTSYGSQATAATVSASTVAGGSRNAKPGFGDKQQNPLTRSSLSKAGLLSLSAQGDSITSHQEQPAASPFQFTVEIPTWGAPQTQAPVKEEPKKPLPVVKKNYEKPWFIPCLRSKYMTIELLKMLFTYKHEVVLFLRSLCKGSAYFLEKFYEKDIDRYFIVFDILIKVPLIANATKMGILMHNDKPLLMKRLNAFTQLESIEAFASAFKISFEINICKYLRGRDVIDPFAVETCLEIVKKHMDDFTLVKFVANEDPASELGGMSNDYISHFFEKFVNTFEQGEVLRAQHIEFSDVDQKYISIFLSHFWRKERQKSSAFGSGFGVPEKKEEKEPPVQHDPAFLAKFSKATALKLQQQMAERQQATAQLNTAVVRQQEAGFTALAGGPSQIEAPINSMGLTPTYMDIIRDQNARFEGAIPFSQSKVESIKLFKCFMDVQNMRQLSKFVEVCANLQELDLTSIINFRMNRYQNPDEFMTLMRSLVSPASCSRTQLRTLGLSNNLLGDDLMKTLVSDVLCKFTCLQSIDISANKMFDDSIQHFFKNFVADNATLKVVKMNFTKIRWVTSCQLIAECVSSCHNLNEIHFRRCGITEEMFIQLLRPSKTAKTGKEDTGGTITFLPARLTHLELGANKIGNDGVKYLKEFLAFQLMNKSRLRYLSLYENDLQGENGIMPVRDMIKDSLLHLEFINMEGNLIDSLEFSVMRSMLARLNSETCRNIQLKTNIDRKLQISDSKREDAK